MSPVSPCNLYFARFDELHQNFELHFYGLLFHLCVIAAVHVILLNFKPLSVELFNSQLPRLI